MVTTIICLTIICLTWIIFKQKFDFTFKVVNEHNYNYPEEANVELPENVYKEDPAAKKVDEFMNDVSKAFDEIYEDPKKKKEVVK